MHDLMISMTPFLAIEMVNTKKSPHLGELGLDFIDVMMIPQSVFKASNTHTRSIAILNAHPTLHTGYSLLSKILQPEPLRQHKQTFEHD
jgi:hypothetical protein